MATYYVPTVPTLLFGTSLIPVKLVETEVTYVIATECVDAGPKDCPQCGRPLHVQETRILQVADLPLHERCVTLEVPVPARRCRPCGKIIYIRPVDLHSSRRMTARLVTHIERAGLERPYADIAKQVGVCEATVADICGAGAGPLHAAYWPKMAETLSIDEVHIRKGTDYAVLSDHDAVQVIEMLETSKKAPLRAALRHLLRPERCRIVTMDMCRRYRDAVREALPDALIVIDKWHVLNMARRNLVTVIREQYRRLTPSCSMTLLALTGLMIERRWDLKPAQRQQLSAELAKSAYLKAAYDAKETFYDLYAVPTLSAAEQYLDAWLGSLPQGMRCAYKELVTALGNWRGEILNYWRTPEPVTNAPAEALNGRIKRINAAGGGYMPFELLRERVLFGEPRRRRREALRRELARTRRRQAAAPEAGA
jgi:transposase